MTLKLKRAYEPASKTDGVRVLVDRLWPRGVSKKTARIDHWFREIAPSAELRKWFNHDPEKWAKFRQKYFRELNANREVVDQLRELLHRGTVTLVYGAKDEEHNDAVAFQEYLTSHRGENRK